MITKVIELEIRGEVIKAEICFSYTPEVPAKLFALPEDCYPAEPEEWEFHELMMQDNNGSYTVDISELMEYIEPYIINELNNLEEW